MTYNVVQIPNNGERSKFGALRLALKENIGKAIELTDLQGYENFDSLRKALRTHLVAQGDITRFKFRSKAAERHLIVWLEVREGSE